MGPDVVWGGSCFAQFMFIATYWYRALRRAVWFIVTYWYRALRRAVWFIVSLLWLC
jgi:hypothetical protein